MEGKKWYLSRTIWVNLIALAALLLKTEAGIALTSEETAGILVVINLILRMITKEPLKY
ncbi:MAG: hypothetical protein KGZ41_05165 [Dethiobacter sp.]|jgi:hypothetical protein|nr:hypothetical protein [Dethiobacter sp.]MBS3900335.1 hypothetical protein [Dethiobacter sp.]MBS3983169.1 hypothetical protein [Dethiobacter sp.]MCL4462628.1 hypothetical protein [Bacillota bacterium]MCL5994023.1 hypothetical protein [Bacillota bacterium]